MEEDCDGGAIGITSLMDHAGIPEERSRWYGGIVRAGSGAETGGHAWAAYKRESDDEWIVLDWCYLPNDDEIDELKPMRFDKNYISDFFSFHPNGATVDSGAVNGVRNPEKLDRWDNYNVVNVGGANINLGNFMNGNGLNVSQELARSGSLEKGVGLTGLDGDGRKIKMVISEFVDSARTKGILDAMQEQSDSRKYGEVLTTTNERETMLAHALLYSALDKNKKFG